MLLTHWFEEITLPVFIVFFSFLSNDLIYALALFCSFLLSKTSPEERKSPLRRPIEICNKRGQNETFPLRKRRRTIFVGRDANDGLHWTFFFLFKILPRIEISRLLSPSMKLPHQVEFDKIIRHLAWKKFNQYCSLFSKNGFQFNEKDVKVTG